MKLSMMVEMPSLPKVMAFCSCADKTWSAAKAAEMSAREVGCILIKFRMDGISRCGNDCIIEGVGCWGMIIRPSGWRGSGGNIICCGVGC